MPSVTLTDDQVVELVQQLPPEDKRRVLSLLAESFVRDRDTRMAYAEAQMQQLAAQRGQNWSALADSEREQLIDNLIHEDRQCCQ
jgi:hypothetical protein